MNKHFKKAWMPAAATSLLVLGACEEDPEKDDPIVNADLLVGEWEIVTIDGETPDDDGDEDYRMTLEFQADGDFSFCYSGEYEGQSYENCYNGDWEWKKVGEVVEASYISIDVDEEGNTTTDTYEVEFTIKKLTETSLEGTWKENEEGEDDQESSEWVLKKI